MSFSTPSRAVATKSSLMLVAQARAEDLTLVTHDRGLEPYGADVLWA